MTSSMISPLEAHDALGDELGVRLLVKRDDLLPFPLAGNKVRKIIAELDSLEGPPELLISNGAIGSNHCQTLAHPGARRGRHRNVPPSERQSEATHGRIKRVLNINAGFLLCVLTLPTRLATATAMKTHDTQCLTDAIKTLLTHPATASHFGVEAHKWVVPALQPESVTRTLPAIVKAPDARGTLQNSEGNANAPKRQ